MIKVKIFLINDLWAKIVCELDKAALNLEEFDIIWNLPYLPIPGDELDWATFLSPNEWDAFAKEHQELLSQISDEESWVISRRWQFIKGEGILYIEIGSYEEYLRRRNDDFS